MSQAEMRVRSSKIGHELLIAGNLVIIDVLTGGEGEVDPEGFLISKLQSLEPRDAECTIAHLAARVVLDRRGLLGRKGIDADELEGALAGYLRAKVFGGMAVSLAKDQFRLQPGYTGDDDLSIEELRWLLFGDPRRREGPTGDPRQDLIKVLGGWTKEFLDRLPGTVTRRMGKERGERILRIFDQYIEGLPPEHRPRPPEG